MKPMLRALSPFLVLPLLTTALRAQGCLFLPDADATTGPASLTPFGANDPLDLQTANQSLVFKVPAAQLPAGPTLIRALGFASAGDRLRHFDVLQVRMGQSQNPQLQTILSQNMTGFTSLVFDIGDWTWNTPADQWTYIGLTSTFPYDPQYGDLVLQLTTAGATSSGTGAMGVHSDPTTPSVLQTAWRFAPGRGVIGTGAPKIRLCWDANDLQTFGGGCVGTNGLTPRLSLAGSSALGQSFTIGLHDAHPASTAAILVLDPRLRGLPVDLAAFGGQAGCEVRTFISFFFEGLPIAHGGVTIPLTVPNDPFALGAQLWAQWLPFDPGIPVIPLSTSNVGRILVGS
ncbi:MAG: hypothetical protein H6834_12025 [Planctomycetes bacterium]|nr:hypothetical protein [Planctomycetota bacterium]